MYTEFLLQFIQGFLSKIFRDSFWCGTWDFSKRSFRNFSESCFRIYLQDVYYFVEFLPGFLSKFFLYFLQKISVRSILEFCPRFLQQQGVVSDIFDAILSVITFTAFSGFSSQLLAEFRAVIHLRLFFHRVYLNYFQRFFRIPTGNHPYMRHACFRISWSSCTDFSGVFLGMSLVIFYKIPCKIFPEKYRKQST